MMLTDVIDIFWFFLQSRVATNWYPFTLGALFLYGFYLYLIDLAVETRPTTLARPVAISALIAGSSLLIVIVTGLYVVGSVLYQELMFNLETALALGLIQGLLFLSVNIFRFEARQVFPSHVVLPIVRSSVLIVILASWFFFDEFSSAETHNLVGFLLIGISIYLFRDFDEGTTSQQDLGQGSTATHSDSQKVKGIVLLLLATVVSATTTLLAKYAVGPSHVNIFLFMFFSNYFTLFAAFYIIRGHVRRLSHEESTEIQHGVEHRHDLADVFKKGMWLGVINLLAFACLLKALSLGSASLVVPIYSLHMVIPILMTVLFQGGKLTEKATVAIVLSIAAVFILE